MRMLDLYREDLEMAEKELKMFLKLHRFPKACDVEYLQKKIDEAKESYVCCLLGC